MSLIIPGETVYARGGDNILTGAVVTASASPMASYALADVLSVNPADRVRVAVRSLRVTCTLEEPAQGDVFLWPWLNLDEAGGSPAEGLSIGNDSGLSVAVPAPGRYRNGIPKSAILDLTEAEPDPAVRTSDVWFFDFTDNSDDLILGGGLSIFAPKRVLNPDLQFGFSYRKQHASQVSVNEHLGRFITNLRTSERTIIASTRTADLAGAEAWFDENAGGAAPGLIWPQGTGIDPGLVVWEPTFEAQNVPGTLYYDIKLTLIELSKGKPV